jgi:hypothetical protein
MLIRCDVDVRAMVKRDAQKVSLHEREIKYGQPKSVKVFASKLDSIITFLKSTSLFRAEIKTTHDFHPERTQEVPYARQLFDSK